MVETADTLGAPPSRPPSLPACARQCCVNQRTQRREQRCRSEHVMKHQARSGYDLFKKCSRLFHTLQIKHGGGGDTRGGTRTDSFDQKGMEWHRRAGICLCVYNRVLKPTVFLSSCFSTCRFIHPPHCLLMSVSLRRLCVCAEFGQHLQTVFCLFASSLAQTVFPCLCQLCEATLSQILWNQLNTSQGLTQIKFAALCTAYVILQCP